MFILSATASTAIATNQPTAFKHVSLCSLLLVFFAAGASISFLHLVGPVGLVSSGTMIDGEAEGGSGSHVLSLCYSWLSEDSNICDALAWNLPHPLPRKEDGFEYSSYVVASETRKGKMERNLHQLVPYAIIPAFETQAHLLDTSDTKSDWDWLDKRMRTAYIVDDHVYPGEAGCTLGHRRVLEAFLHTSNKQAALVLEDDAVPIHHKMVLSHLDEVVEAMNAADEDWDFVQLGRCWDIMCHQQVDLAPLATFSNGVTLLPSQGFEFCSHSYLVSRRGAEKILQYTLPMVLPYDLTIMLHSRNKLLNAYFTSENLFYQDESFSSLIRSTKATKPICHPGMTLSASKIQTRRVKNYDPVLLERINKSTFQEMVSVETRKLQDSRTVADAEASRQQLLSTLCAKKKPGYCVGKREERMVEEIHSFCELLGGENASYLDADVASKEFIDEMDKADLDGIVVWGLRPDVQHTHKHIHSGVHKAAAAALSFSRKRRHLCYGPENTVLDLGRHLYHNASYGRLARSLVFASPKHMTWSDDPGFVMLPIEASSRYIFHGQTPRPHTVLRREGFAVEWEAWGPDGWTPDIDSDAYIRGQPWNLSEGCQIDNMLKTKRCADRRLLVQPWAAFSTPAEIQENKKDVKTRAANAGRQKTMHFQGSVWDCNINNVLQFTKGCAEEGIEVIRYGNNIAAEFPRFYHDELREQLFDEDNFFMEQTSQSLQQLFKEKSASYGPAFQGECHFADDTSESYIADRILNLIGIGTWPMTNNPASFELLGNSSAIVFDTNVTELCKKATMHQPTATSLYKLMDAVALNHTYISRLTTILQFVTDEVPLVAARDTLQAVVADDSQIFGRNVSHSSVALDTKSLKLALRECAGNIECVLARVPVHANWNRSQGVLFGSHNRMGTGLAGSLVSALPSSRSILNDHMTFEDYSAGRPVVHFIRDPLEVVVSGYSYHSTANTTWLETSGYKMTLRSKSLANGLEKEFHGAGMWNIENAVGVHQMMKHNTTIQQNFFTVRIDDVRDALMFNLTTQALQKWLGIDQSMTWDDLELCCFRPKHVVSDPRKPEMRKIVMDKHSVKIYALRRELDFPAVGLEVWAPPSFVARFLTALLLGTMALLISVCSIRTMSAISCKLPGRKEKSSTTLSEGNSGINYVFRGFIARFCHELSSKIGLFQLRDPFFGMDLNVQETFAPRPAWKLRCIRLVLFLWSLHVFWVDMHLFQFPGFYFAFFSQVTFGLTIAYYFVSLCVAFSGTLKQPESTTKYSQPSTLVCFYWACYAGIVTSQFIVTTVHWSTNLNFFLNVLPRAQRYPSVMKHGVFFVLTLWEGQVYSRIPLRAKMYVFPLGILLLYTAWTYYQSLFGPSNPFFYGQEHEWAHPDDDDAVYSQLNWRKRPGLSLLSVVYGMVFAPLHFMVLWMSSAWFGKNRRFVLKKK